MTLTANEIAVLNAVRFNYFHDGADPIANWVWSDCINDSNRPSGIEGKSLSGVCGSLAQKGFLKSSGSGRDSCVCITAEGAAALDAIAA